MEGRKILCYPDRLSPHGRDDMWDMALGVWPCSAVLGKRLSEPSPASSSSGDCDTARQQCQSMGCSGSCPCTIPSQTGTMAEQE